MRKLFGFPLLGLVLLVFVTPVFAQDAAEEEEKDIVEISAFVGKSIPQGGIKDYQDSLGAKSGFETGIEAGYFVSPKLVIGFHFSYSQFKLDDAANADGLDHKLYFPGIYVKYLINTNSNFVPYVKGVVGLQNAKFTRYVENIEGNRYRAISHDPVIGTSIGAGLFWYTADYSGIYGEVDYTTASTTNTEATYAGNTYKLGEQVRAIDVRFGIRFLIGSGE